MAWNHCAQEVARCEPKGEALRRVLVAWTALMHDGDASLLEQALDDDVVWHGLLPELVCRNRDEVMRLFGRYRARPPSITRLEAQGSCRSPRSRRIGAM